MVIPGLLTACSSPQENAYQQRIDCVANELALHIFIDQASDPSLMFGEDGQRFIVLRARAEQAGLATHRSKSEVSRDIRRSAAAAMRADEDRDPSVAAVRRAAMAKRCLARPAGSTAG